MRKINSLVTQIGVFIGFIACTFAMVAHVGRAKDSSQADRKDIVHLTQSGPRQVDQDGTIHVPAFLLSESSLLSRQSHAELKRARELKNRLGEDQCPPMEGAHRSELRRIRECQAEAFYKSTYYKKMRNRYDVVMTPERIGGVYTEVFTPKEGISASHKERVLINLHGGHFEFGSRVISHLESIPIASIGKIKVISIDYRLAPEYTFPAASEDVAAVYREVLKSYKPQNIGLYGCSAGGLLAAESIAWFQRASLPIPGAVGMFCAGASYYQEGVSTQIAAALEGFHYEPSPVHPYFKDTDPSNPLAFPIYSQQTMARFPPSLLIASTTDLALSSVAHTQSVLVDLGVEADLHVWEGVGHAFFYDPDLPESQQAYDVIVRFFDNHLEY
jgi:acetyl esterase/lipase